MSATHPWFKLPEQRQPLPKGSASDASVVIVGCGLAGCHTAFELANRGINVIMLDSSERVAGGASGNTAGIVKPFVTRSPGITDRFYASAFSYLIERFASDQRLCKAAQFNQCGVLQLFENEYPASNAYTSCSPREASTLAGVHIDSPAVFFKNGGWLNPSALCKALIAHKNIEVRLQHRVASISRANNQWSVAIETGAETNTNHTVKQRIECQLLILANGQHANRFGPTQDLPIAAARGQTSRFTAAGDATLKTVVTGKRYAIPVGKDVLVGASFTRDLSDTQILACEHKQNLAGLTALLPSLPIDPVAHSGFCGIRATTPDRFPMVGPVPDISTYHHDYARLKDGLAEHRFPNASYQDGLCIIGGFGSRGIVSAPYCAKLLVDHLCGSIERSKTHKNENTPDLASWSALLHPARFKVRELKRARGLL